ncbi:hypothetical protein OH809_06750 [Streptomyces sp. NBC_00873]|uniref:hypothetical protein n=1 Tax=Streptomyces sp. NBC_00873 TaxID=2975852 RepID=UPI00386F640E|nr:hypothetical protein OH809_06750 [Streptomyces sp. NBC_00873]
MTDPLNSDWPTVELDPLRRLKVIASASKHASYAERLFDVPVERLWAVVSDLQRELPHIVPGLRSFAITSSEKDRLTGQAVSAFGHREHFDVVLRPGWCLMQSKVLSGGMAAVAEGDGTRLAFFSSLRFPGGQTVDRVRRLSAERRTSMIFDRLQQRVDVRSLPGVTK